MKTRMITDFINHLTKVYNTIPSNFFARDGTKPFNYFTSVFCEFTSTDKQVKLEVLYSRLVTSFITPPTVIVSV